MMEMNQPVLRSTPSQCLPGLIPYLFGAASNLRFNQLWSGMSWGTTNPDSFIFSLSPRFGRTSSGRFLCTMSKRYVKLVLNSLISTTKNESQLLDFTKCAIGSPSLILSLSILSSSGSSLQTENTNVTYFYFLISREHRCYLLQGTRCTNSKTKKESCASAKQKMGSSVVKHSRCIIHQMYDLDFFSFSFLGHMSNL